MFLCSVCFVTEGPTQIQMTSAEVALCGLRQGGLGLERYVEEFLEISNRMSWHEAALGACFLLGLDDEVIRCDLPVSDFPLIELINLILFLNCSDEEVEEIPRPRHPTTAGTRRISPAHPTPRTSRLPNHKDPPCLRSSSILLSPEPPSSAKPTGCCSPKPCTRAARAPPRVCAARAPPKGCACSSVPKTSPRDAALPENRPPETLRFPRIVPPRRCASREASPRRCASREASPRLCASREASSS